MESRRGTSTINISVTGGSDDSNQEIEDLIAQSVETVPLDDGTYTATITVTSKYDDE